MIRMNSVEKYLGLGNGIYTIPEIANILRLPYYKVNNWVNKYWDGRLGAAFEKSYSWKIDDTRAVSFHTLIEFYVFYQFAEVGVRTNKVLDAHIELTRHFNTLFPFAKSNILKNIRTDGKRIYLQINNLIISLDGTKQLNLDFIDIFFRNLEFDDELLACKYWPLGKNNDILVDPKRQFGHPVIGETNIFPEAIYEMYKGGEPIPFIASLYGISEKAVNDAIIFCSAA